MGGGSGWRTRLRDTAAIAAAAAAPGALAWFLLHDVAGIEPIWALAGAGPSASTAGSYVWYRLAGAAQMREIDADILSASRGRMCAECRRRLFDTVYEKRMDAREALGPDGVLCMRCYAACGRRRSRCFDESCPGSWCKECNSTCGRPHVHGDGRQLCEDCRGRGLGAGGQ